MEIFFVIYASKFIPINIEHCLLIVMLINGKTLKFAWCFREFVSELDINYPLLKWEVTANALK